ncbi:capsular polysaccharide biosynthesis protein [Mycolicibacterium rhodesiae NBB3]|uniref:Capsular polysaccharide biosynthesis protein n=1 Tax=Mycolicibacterium rhodesiae (strain NBB3) TaxID=710685 RepID=G8RTL3_MYCRN|nr:capsular polysaccharide biosynthesis protein [Mycolicibacterium rhodesiae]AEV75387.1 capsular polysaccharide biosynthesis protein [Mycolicibacterium rhodesiae NBB3]
MDFRRYLDFLRGQWEWIAIATTAGGVIAMILALTATPKFAATAELFLATPGYSGVASIDTADNSPFQADAFSQQRARSYVELATRQDLARRVVDNLQLPMSPADLSSAVSARVRPDTVLIAVTVKASSPVDAQNLANAVTIQLADDIRRLETPAGMRIPNVDPVITQPAEAPNRPTDPNIAVYALLGISIGFLVGVTGAVVGQRRRFITDARTVEAVGGLPVLGVVEDSGERGLDWSLAALSIEHALPVERPVILAVTEANEDAGESAAATIELTAALACFPDIIVVDASRALERIDDVSYGLRDEVDQVLVVVVTGRMRQSELRAAVERLRAHDLSILGAVLAPPARLTNSYVNQKFSVSSKRRVAE